MYIQYALYIQPMCFEYIDDGFEYKNPTAKRVPITKAEALQICHSVDFLNATEEDNCLHLNKFSSNDMW